MRAGGLGLLVLSGVLALALAIERLAAAGVRIADALRRVRRRLAGGAVAVLAFGCAPERDVSRAVGHGPGAVLAAIEAGGSVEAPGAAGPPLLAAVYGDAPDVVALLLSRGARPDVLAPDGATPLHAAARRGQPQAAALLVAALRDAKRDAPDALRVILDAPAGARRRTAVHDAVAVGSVETLTALLAAGASPDRADSFGQTPLHLLAALDGARAAAIAPLLLRAGADPAAADARGWSAVHAAAFTGNASLIRELVSARLELATAATVTGDTPIDVALRYERDAAADLLFRRGGSPSSRLAWPALHAAAREDAAPRVAALLSAGADPRATFRGATPIDLARRTDAKQAIALLAEAER